MRASNAFIQVLKDAPAPKVDCEDQIAHNKCGNKNSKPKSKIPSPSALPTHKQVFKYIITTNTLTHGLIQLAQLPPCILPAGKAPDMPPKLPMPCWAAIGNCATPQRQEHWQLPDPSVVPVPLAMEVAAGGAAATDVAAGGAAAAAELAGGAAPAAVPFCCIAMAMNIAWLFAAVGLMLKVMPMPQ